jgi:hypothetical protein
VGIATQLEPFITDTKHKNDIITTGSHANGLSREDIDITIVSFAPQASQLAALLTHHILARLHGQKNHQTHPQTP